MLGHAKVANFSFEEEHYSPMCARTIPESWSADVSADLGRGYARLSKVMGDSPQQIVKMLEAEFSKVRCPVGLNKTWTHGKRGASL